RSLVVQAQVANALPYGLTTRELEVLTLVVGGLTNSAMSKRLFVSERTVSTHLVNILRKMGVSTRTTAGVIALDTGLLLLPFPRGLSEVPSLGQFRPRQVLSHAHSRPVRRRSYRLGTLLPFSDAHIDDGLEMLGGTHLALVVVNGPGGIRGR